MPSSSAASTLTGPGHGPRVRGHWPLVPGKPGRARGGVATARRAAWSKTLFRLPALANPVGLAAGFRQERRAAGVWQSNLLRLCELGHGHLACPIGKPRDTPVPLAAERAALNDGLQQATGAEGG